MYPASRIHLFVRELGTTQFREVTLPQHLKTKTNLELQVQATLGNPNPMSISLLDDVGLVIKNDQDVSSLTSGNKLEVAFVNRFYWVPSAEQIRQWKVEFISVLDPGHHKLRGDQARQIFLPNPRVSQAWLQDLVTIWWLADLDKDNMLTISEYVLAKFLIHVREKSQTIPQPLPQILLDCIKGINLPSSNRLSSTPSPPPPSTPPSMSIWINKTKNLIA
eukprot:TRINITY_DN24858_c0_g1_i2.p1 TRINITY_DN24858_c0_g1~~TRINITY_DN24858_c0_g1_i2.p1  ORF type:complete len:220 (-),score=30.90 TRINITY_DN24858_c0_g1_i2:55-714(-)